MQEDSSKEPATFWGLVYQGLKDFGFPIVACVFVAYFANSAIVYERDKMLPAIENNTKILETNNEVIRSLNLTLRELGRESASRAQYGHDDNKGT